jgi:hypothetical protein
MSRRAFAGAASPSAAAASATAVRASVGVPTTLADLDRLLELARDLTC